MQLGKYAEYVVISDIDIFKEKLDKLKLGGLEKLHLVSDFDWTITKQSNPDKKLSSSFGIMKRSGVLSNEFLIEEENLRQKYFPYEHSISIKDEERFLKMKEWWTKYIELLSKQMVSKKYVENLFTDNKIHYRKYFSEIVDLTNENNIPLLVFSSGLGCIIKGFLKKDNLLRPNIDIVSNFFKYNAEGFICGYENDIMHIANKSEKFISAEFKKDIEGRRNVILMGDSLMDCNMVDDKNADVILRIGFLNINVSEKISAYKEIYDVVILYDSDMEFVYELLGEIGE